MPEAKPKKHLSRVRAWATAAALLVFCAQSVAAQKPMWVLLRSDAVRTGELITPERARPSFANDHAIPKSLISKIERTGAKIRYESRWLQAVSVDADARALAQLRKMREVRDLQPIGQMHAAATPALSRSRGPALRRAAARADFDSAFYGPNWRPIRQLGIPSSHLLGFTGSGVRIAIIDTGFEPSHDALITRRIAAQRDFIHRDNIVANQPGEAEAFDQEAHGTWVWSILGGHRPGLIVGPAFDGVFILAKVDVVQSGNDQLAADEDRWVAAVEWADSMGARIINSSIGFRNFVDKPDYPISALDGRTARATIMADEAARRGILVINAVGNLGPLPQSLWAPADADSIIAVGAVDPVGEALPTSSRGPTGDGRLKPELVAPATGITAARSAQTSSYDSNLEGTSMATPFIAGGAAMFMQAWPNLTIMAVRSALMQSGTRAESPDNNVGFGVPNISSAIAFPEGLTPFSPTGVNLANQLTTLQPTFTWSVPLIHNSVRPVRYRLEIATDPNFSNIIYTDTTEAFSLMLKRPLRPAAALWWRVIAEANPNIRRSTRVAGPFSVPDWVRLLTFNTPTTSHTDSVQPTFRWEALTAPPPIGPLTFDVQILNAQTGVPVQTISNLSVATARPPIPLTPNILFSWRVIARSPLGVADTVDGGRFLVTSEQQPPTTLLYQNFPNYFPRPDLGELATHIWFDVNTQSTVELAVYDLRGRLVRQLIPAAPSCGEVTLEPGQYGRAADADACIVTTWDGRTANGDFVPKGVYILRLRAGGVDQVKKILFLPQD